MTARLKADERREAVIDAATVAFAEGGFAGTSAESIAERAGVSQPYLFQLFGTKKEIFLAVVRACFVRTARRLEGAASGARAAGLDDDATLLEMGNAYTRMLLADRNLLRVQLHAYAACGDPEVRVVVRDAFAALWRDVARMSGADPADDAASTFDEFIAQVCGGVPAMT